MRRGTVYTETVVHAAPERFTADAPYQVAIVELESGGRCTARIDGQRVEIGNLVIEVASKSEIPFFKKHETR
jgi:uncharacterized OB-fold protein